MQNSLKTNGASCAPVSKQEEAGMKWEPTVKSWSQLHPNSCHCTPDHGEPDTAGAASPPYSSNQ